jgi:DNA-binding NarL/FixJ family response regulator
MKVLNMVAYGTVGQPSAALPGIDANARSTNRTKRGAKPQKQTASPRQKAARIILVDDHPILRRGLAQLISQDGEFVVCGQFDDAKSALASIPSLKPDLVVVDLTLKGGNGLDLIKSIKANHSKLFVLVLSMHDEVVYAERAMRAGASGYVMKQEAPEQLLASLRSVLAGDISLSSRMSERLMRQIVGGRRAALASPIERLSDRELEVFNLIGQGRGTRQIANQLFLSVKTIESHRAHIKEKLELKTAAELMRHAIQMASN